MVFCVSSNPMQVAFFFLFLLEAVNVLQYVVPGFFILYYALYFIPFFISYYKVQNLSKYQSFMSLAYLPFLTCKHYFVQFIKQNPTRCNNVSKFYYFIFIWNSACFGQHTATALAASGFSHVPDNIHQLHIQQPSTY